MVKRCHLTEEHKQRIGKSRVGISPSNETRRKISDAQKGRTRPPVSDITRQKLSESTKKRYENQIERNKTSIALKGHKVTEETRNKISKSRSGKTPKRTKEQIDKYLHEWYLKNKDKKKQKYLEHREEKLNYLKEYYKINIDKIKENNKKYYIDHKEQLSEYQWRKYKGDKRHAALLKIDALISKGGACIFCGYKFDGINACVFDFHHIDPEQKTINIAHCRDRKKLNEELKKCMLVCSNCHRLIHNGGF